jgi:hypothetical protein
MRVRSRRGRTQLPAPPHARTIEAMEISWYIYPLRLFVRAAWIARIARANAGRGLQMKREERDEVGPLGR